MSLLELADELACAAIESSLFRIVARSDILRYATAFRDAHARVEAAEHRAEEFASERNEWMASSDRFEGYMRGVGEIKIDIARLFEAGSTKKETRPHPAVAQLEAERNRRKTLEEAACEDARKIEKLERMLQGKEAVL